MMTDEQPPAFLHVNPATWAHGLTECRLCGEQLGTAEVGLYVRPLTPERYAEDDDELTVETYADAGWALHVGCASTLARALVERVGDTVQAGYGPPRETRLVHLSEWQAPRPGERN